jgi:hypothetical protein
MNHRVRVFSTDSQAKSPGFVSNSLRSLSKNITEFSLHSPICTTFFVALQLLFLLTTTLAPEPDVVAVNQRPLNPVVLLPLRLALVATLVEDLSSQEFLHCKEFQVLQAHFSSGVLLRELSSIAIIIASLSGIKQPNRETRRRCPLLMQWYHNNWDTVGAWLPYVSLRDERLLPIDQWRERLEKKAME